MIGEEDYLESITKQSPFFVDHASMLPSMKRDHWIAESLIPDTWYVTRREPWTYVSSPNGKMRVNGWKIHLSATKENAEKILAEVIQICCKYNTTFKFQSSHRDFLNCNGKAANRSGSGKFITIYPSTNDELEKIVGDLYPLIKDEKGPYILSDIRYKQSPIFFRYGGFIDLRREDENNDYISMIPDQSGILVADKRLPHFIHPAEGIDKPKCVEISLNEYMKNIPTDLDNYEIKAVHFSNSGGVYRATNKKNEIALLKEARPYAGLDARQRDAIERLSIEWKMLNLLKNTGIAPKPYRRFNAWEHGYIEMEWLNEITLNHWLSENYPYQCENDHTNQLMQYRSDINTIATSIINAVKIIHRTGYVHGDIHLGNIMINPKTMSIHFIDFEDGRTLDSKEISAHNAMGFHPPLGCSAQEADWFAVSRVLACLCYANTSICMLSPDHWIRVKNNISKKFGMEYINLLKDVESRCPCASGVSDVPLTPDAHLTQFTPRFSFNLLSHPDSLSLVKTEIINGIFHTRHKLPGKLYPGDVTRGSIWGASNVSSGAAGILMSLHRANSIINSDDVQWMKDMIHGFAQSNQSDFGLYTGLSGIGLVAFELGELETAHELLFSTYEHWKETRNLDLNGGLAGQGLALISYGMATDDKRYFHEAIALGHRIAQWMESNQIASIKQGGLLHGWSGIALFWLALSRIDIEHNPAYIRRALNCICRDLDNTVIEPNGMRGIKDKHNRSLPYLADGSGGLIVAISIARIALHDDSLFHKEWDSLIAACSSSQYAFSGLNNGIAGILVANHFASTWSPQTTQTNNRLLDELNDYSLSWENTLQFPGDSYLRLSSDYSTGSAGILTALNVLTHNLWDLFPLPNAKDLFCGRSAEQNSRKEQQ